MYKYECLDINSNGHLTIGGLDCVDLVKQFKSPLYVMDEKTIRRSCRTYKKAMDEFYDNGLVLYASKALSCVQICKIVKEEGLGLDVVSGGELYTAIRAGFDMDKVYFHGNNKTISELSMAIENNVGRIVVDNKYEVENINNIAKKLNKKVKVLIRIKPGVEAHTHEFIKTGQIDSKFGFAIETGEASEIVDIILKNENIELVGVHCHIGSQIFDIEPFKLAAEVMMEFISSISTRQKISELNLGGGYGIKYVDGQEPIEYGEYIKAVSETVKSAASRHGLCLPKILMEPGRSIVGDAGVTLYTVGAVKTIPNVRTYVSVDGGMTDNPRYIMYQAEYDAVVANKANLPVENVVTVAGKCCESGDILIQNIKLPPVEVGDILAVLATGAYNYSMSSNYNRILRPPVVLIKENREAKIIVKGETYDDIIRNDIDG